MGQRAPTAGQIAVAVAFAFSCFGLLLFLWSAFGGPIPFKPEGYRVNVPVSEAANVAVESDVRISNVSVGKVKKIELSDEGDTRDLAIATIEIDNAYAPIPENTLATLRQKTLLGETYVELTQGDKDGPKIPEGGSLPPAQVAPSVQLDEIFRTFDARTRAAFQTWMQQAALAFQGRGADVSATIANLEPFAEDANRVLRVLDTQQNAVSALVRNTGEVFGALSERQGQLQGLIRTSGTVFATTARRNQDLRELFIALPTFLDESKLTLNRLETFAQENNSAISQFHPSARALSGTLKQLSRLSPELYGFFLGFRKVASRAQTGLPALRQLLDVDLPPVLVQIQPFTRQLSPLVEVIGLYQRDFTGLLGNLAGAAQGVGASPETNQQATHYLRTAAPLHPDALATYPDDRLTTNRSNPYIEPGGALKLAGGLEGFETRFCAAPPGVTAVLNPAATVADPDFIARAQISSTQQLFDTMKLFGFNDQNLTAGVAAPACTKQAPQRSIGQIPELTDYLHTYQYAP